MLVIGVGHRDRGDDGGPFVADLVIGRGGRGLIAEGNLADLSMRWERDDDVVIVDAVVTGAAPGTIHELDAVEVAGRRVAADLVRSSYEQRPITVS